MPNLRVPDPEWHLTGKPYEVQIEALRAARHRPGFAYLMEMGLGKTAVVLNEFLDLHKRGEVDALVVVCPNSLKGVWRDEAIKFGAGLEVRAWPQTPRDLSKPFILAINYEAIRGQGGDYVSGLMSVVAGRRIYLALDESINIKDPRSLQTKAAMRLSRLATVRRILTGMPITQGPQDVWSQLTFLGAPLGQFYAFRGAYCEMGGFMNKKVMGLRDDRRQALDMLLRMWSYRAEKRDWTDIPEITTMPVRTVEMRGEQRRVYRDMEDAFFAALPDADAKVSAEIILTKILRLQQVSSGFVTDDNGKTHDIVTPAGNPKIQEVLDILAETRGKALIFTMFRRTVELLQAALVDYDPVTLVGGQEDIDDHKARFESDPACRVMIVQIQAGKYGHTLLGGGECATSIFMENSWSLDARLQAEARNHRHGQRNNVVVHDLSASDIEALVIAAVRSKRTQAEAIVSALRDMKRKR